MPRPAVLAIFVAGYAIAVLLGEHSYGSLSVPSPFWLPDSVLLVALLLSPRSHWWAFALIIWPVRILIGVVPGTPLWFQLVTLANDMVKGLGAAWLLNRFIRRPIHLNTLHEFMVFLAIAAAVPAMSAMAAAPARYALGDPFWQAAAGWFLGNAVAQVVVTPMILYWCRRAFGWRVGRLEAIGAACGVGGAVYLSFFDNHSWAALVSIYLPIPFLIWVAVRIGPFGAANALTLVSIVAMWGAVEGRGIFAGLSPANAVLSIQLFLLVVATSVLSLAILVGEREALQSREAAWNRRLIDAQDEERSRIAAELHDDIGQQLAVLLIDMYRIASSAPTEESRRKLRSLLDATARLSTDIRHVSHNLHPLIVETVGVESAVRGLCQRFVERRTLSVDLKCEGVPPHLPPALSLCLYRLVQEGLQNVVKHSGAGGANVEIVARDGRLNISVSDCGRGFDPANAIVASGLGLVSMRERVRSLGGSLAIETAAQAGTRISASIPLPDRGGNSATRQEAAPTTA